MPKFRINAKMLAGFLLMSSLLVVGGGVTIVYTYHLHQVTSDKLEANINGLRTAQKLQITLFQMRGYAFNYIWEKNPRWLNKLEQDRTTFYALLEKVRGHAADPQEAAALRKLVAQFGEYETNLQAVLREAQTGDEKNARTLLLRVSREEYEVMYEQCEAIVAAKESAMNDMQDEIEHANYLVRLTMYGLIFGGVTLGGLLGWLISRSIAKPIYELMLKLRDVPGGELIERFDVSGGAELEELDRHVHELIERINTTTADLEKNRRLLARAEKLAALGRVAAGVAHEIRNPLTAIKMLIYALRDDLVASVETRDDLEVIFKEIERMERFVQNFLDFARPPNPRFAQMEIAPTLRETLALLAPRLHRNQIQVMEHYSEAAKTVWADSDQIKQVLMNLLLNAVEFMPHGGKLQVETKLEEPRAALNASAKLQIRISDSGKGIPHELLENLFDPFVSGREDGIGLGLSIAHQIVHRHHGSMEAMNNPEGGATFVVSLPVEAYV